MEQKVLTSDVYLTRLIDHSDWGSGVGRAMDGLLPQLNIQGKRVFLKVNLMKGAAAEKALNTHPEIIRHLIRWVRNQGGDPRFGDSCGIPGHTMQAARAAGYLELAREEEVPFINLDSGPFAPISSRIISGHSFWVSRELLDAEVRITVPKLKSHTLMIYSGALKNQMGILPGGTKARVHIKAPRINELARVLLEINDLVPFQAALMDGTYVLEGGGSQKGMAKYVGYLFSSRDLKALDLAVCSSIGFKAVEIPLFVEAARNDKELLSPGRFILKGDQPDETALRLRKPGLEIKKQPLAAMAYYWLRERSYQPVHNPSLCQECDTCVQICPTRAISRQNGYSIDRQMCIYCCACTSSCPQGALTLRAPWYLRPWLKSRLQGMESA